MSTTTIAAVFTSAIATATDIFSTNLPVIISFAVGIILFFVLWKLFKKATKSK